MIVEVEPHEAEKIGVFFVNNEQRRKMREN